VPTPFVWVGRIVRPHGTSGEVSIQIERGISAEELPGSTVWIVPPPEGGARPHRILSARPGPKGLLLCLEGVDAREAARELGGRWLLASAESVSIDTTPEPDLIGYAVVDRERGAIGRVTQVLATGANDVLVVEGDTFGQVLVPVIDDVVVAVDDAEQQVSVILLDGLIDEAGS